MTKKLQARPTSFLKWIKPFPKILCILNNPIYNGNGVPLNQMVLLKFIEIFKNYADLQTLTKITALAEHEGKHEV